MLDIPKEKGLEACYHAICTCPNPKASKGNWCTKQTRYPIIVTLIGNPHFLGIGRVYPRGCISGNLKGWKLRVMVKIYSPSHWLPKSLSLCLKYEVNEVLDVPSWNKTI
jgi:hypothetical protein